MSKLKNTFDLGKALGEDILTSTTRLHDHLHEYYTKRYDAKEASGRDPIIHPRMAALSAQVHMLLPQVLLSGIVDILARKNGFDIAPMLTVATTVMATNGPFMRSFDKLAADYDQLKNSYDDFFAKLGGEELPPLEFEYDKQAMYPNSIMYWKIFDQGGVIIMTRRRMRLSFSIQKY